MFYLICIEAGTKVAGSFKPGTGGSLLWPSPLYNLRPYKHIRRHDRDVELCFEDRKQLFNELGSQTKELSLGHLCVSGQHSRPMRY